MTIHMLSTLLSPGDILVRVNERAEVSRLTVLRVQVSADHTDVRVYTDAGNIRLDGQSSVAVQS